MARSTIKDIAKHLGVSPSTISRALSDHPDISKEMKKKVEQVAKEFHYTKNRRASSLRTKEPGIIALIIPEVNMFFMPELIYGINTEAEKKDLSVAIFQSDNSLEKEKKLLQYCLEMSFSGILLCLSFETNNLSHIHSVIGNEIPVVLLDKVILDSNCSTVSIQDEDAGYKSANYLLENGHQNVIGIFGNSELEMTQLRKMGFAKAFLENRVDESNLGLIEIEGILTLDTALEEELRQKPETTAIFCMSDELLINAHHLLMKLGYKIPNEISLISISDGFVPYYLFPNITHLHHSGFEVGYEALKVMASHLDNPNRKPDCTYLKTKFFEMQSVISIN